MANIGILKENQNNESRVALNNVSVSALNNGKLKNNVYITSDAGKLSGVNNEEYIKAGATILPTNKDVIQQSDIIVKIGKPSIEELSFFRPHQVLFCFLNLAANPEYAKELAKRKITAIGYELIYEPEQDRYPILAVMAELVGKISYTVGSSLLSSPGSKGVLLGGLGSTKRSKVVIFGGGHAGQAFMKMADNAGSRVVVFESDSEKLQKINSERPHIETMYPFEEYIKKEIKNADLVLGATFRGGKQRVQKLITEQMIKEMESKSVIIDLTYESGGLTENTTFNSDNHSYTMTKNDVIHYWKSNIATLVPASATSALAAPVLKYLLRYLISNKQEDHVIENAIATKNGAFADWIHLDQEQKDLEYQQELEKLINNEDDDFDLFNMVDSEIQEENNFSVNILEEQIQEVKEPNKKIRKENDIEHLTNDKNNFNDFDIDFDFEND